MADSKQDCGDWADNFNLVDRVFWTKTGQSARVAKNGCKSFQAECTLIRVNSTDELCAVLNEELEHHEVQKATRH
jgi:hypothetical protein